MTSRVYFQDTEGWVVETFWWKGQIRGYQRCFAAKMRTPLAVISWKENEEVAHLNETSITKQIRLYSLSVNDQLQEYAYSSHNPQAGWTAGSLPSIPALWGSKLAAVCWEDTGGDIQIRLYYQGDDDSSIESNKSRPIRRHQRIVGQLVPAMARNALNSFCYMGVRPYRDDLGSSSGQGLPSYQSHLSR
jgi:hypothetical protein